VCGSQCDRSRGRVQAPHRSGPNDKLEDTSRKPHAHSVSAPSDGKSRQNKSGVPYKIKWAATRPLSSDNRTHLAVPIQLAAPNRLGDAGGQADGSAARAGGRAGDAMRASGGGAPWVPHLPTCACLQLPVRPAAPSPRPSALPLRRPGRPPARQRAQTNDAPGDGCAGRVRDPRGVAR
jgi:hypothetical protein